MIFLPILEVIYAVLFLILSPLRLLDDATLDANVASSVTTAGGYLGNVSHFFPVYTLLIILGLIIAFELGVLTYKGIMWLIRKIPTVN